MSASLDPRVWWWVTRSSGIVAWVVVAAAVLWGLLASTKLIRRRGVPAWILDLHRYLGTLTIVFVAIHVGAIYADSFVKFGPREIFVPFASTWRIRPLGARSTMPVSFYCPSGSRAYRRFSKSPQKITGSPCAITRSLRAPLSDSISP